MANQFYDYNPGSYGGGGGAITSIYSSRSITDLYIPTDTSLLGTSSMYLTADSLSFSSAISSSMLYNPDSYRIPGLSATTPTQSNGPPGVDTESTVACTESAYAGLKRSSSDKYEPFAYLPPRPGEKDCAYYMQTRTCKFGDSCKFDHPIWVPEGGIPDWKEVAPVPSEALPDRPGEPDCPYFVKTQRCKFGFRCKFNHPKDTVVPPGASQDGNLSALPERPSEPPCAFYLKTRKCKFGATCKFHHPRDLQIQSSGEENSIGLQSKIFIDLKPQPPFTPALLHNTKGLPIRPSEEDCPFYLKTGSCKYGSTCRYNHPDRYAVNPPAAAIASTLLTTSQTPFNLGVVGPAASLLPIFDPRLTQTMLLSSTTYPQRPGQPECDYYMKFGTCNFGDSCKFHHPFDHSVATSSKESLQQSVKLNLAGLPRREGAVHCPYYMKTGTCKYGTTCKFDHPPSGEVMTQGTSQGSSATTVM